MRAVLVLLALAACRSPAPKPGAVDAGPADAPPAAADAPVIGFDAPPPSFDAPPAVDATPGDAVPDAPAPDAEIATLYDQTVRGNLVVLGGDAGVLEDVAVTLVCDRAKAPDEDAEEQRCDSRLTVDRAGTTVARNDSDVAGIAFRAVGGNNGSLELSLLELEADSGASYIRVRASSQEGDERMTGGSDDQLFAVRGDELVKVLQLTTRSFTTPGEDLETDVAPGRKKTLGMRNLIATERDARGRTRAVVTYVWDGAGYVEKKKPVGDSPH